VSLAGRLYRGETNFDLVGTRKRWYLISAVLLVICIVSIVWRGFNFGIEFAGGNQFLVPASSKATVSSVEEAVGSTGAEVAQIQQVGSGSTRQIQVRTAEISVEKARDVKEAIAKEVGLDPSRISDDAISSAWGGDVTRKALTGLLAFLVLVCVYIGFRFEPKMAIAAIVALFHDVLLAAGIYSIVGFEVTPSTIVGFLTILGFSLYDTVVVFDKVAENTKGLLGGSRMTYSEAANLAVNQTFMRSINTSLVALLPVAGLLFVGAGLLGVGTLKDLALVLFVGLASGAYSSLFLATPILADLREREPAVAALRKRVLAKRAGGTTPPKQRAGQPAATATGPKTSSAPVTTKVLDRQPDDDDEEPTSLVKVPAAAAKRPASRPSGRPGGQQARKKGGRPSGSKRKRR